MVYFNKNILITKNSLSINLWAKNNEKFSLIKQFSFLETNYFLNSFEISPDKKWIVLACTDNTIKIVSLFNEKVILSVNH